MPRRSVSPGAMSLTMVCSWARLALIARPASQRTGEAADLVVWHGLLTAGIVGLSTPGRAGQGSVGEGAAGGLCGLVEPGPTRTCRGAIVVQPSRPVPPTVRQSTSWLAHHPAASPSSAVSGIGTHRPNC